MTVPVPFAYHRCIHWGETDPAKIVYTTNFLQYAMEAVEAWIIEFLDVSWYELTNDLNMGTPVIHCDIDFKNTLTPRHRLRCEVTITKLGNSSTNFHIDGFRDQGSVLSFMANITTVWTNEKHTPIPIPQEYREKIQNYINACENTTQE